MLIENTFKGIKFMRPIVYTKVIAFLFNNDKVFFRVHRKDKREKMEIQEDFEWRIILNYLKISTALTIN